MDWLFACMGAGAREIGLFAALGFILLGGGDLMVDALWIVRVFRERVRRTCDDPAVLEAPYSPGLLAVFIPAWDESVVIRAMLQNALATFRDAEYRIYVGCYPNDPATVREARSIADPRVRIVIGPVDGPTTKADCLNRLWEAMLADEAAENRQAKAVVLHDAEDVVHPAELAVFDRLSERFDLVQLPVVPLIDPNSRWIAGHYADEFAEAHGKELVVRAALGVGLPSAGVGCAFAREALARAALQSSGLPFDADSLTEDYELGLRLRATGGRSVFVRLVRGGTLVATEEYFPGTIGAAVAQKARWMTGIALSGWDRLGWSGGLAERWMRLRDRQSVLAAIFLLAAYVTLLSWSLAVLGHVFLGIAPAPVPAFLAVLLQINFCMFLWRIVMRFTFVTRAYGWREGLRSIPRVITGNIIAMMAARAAVVRYLRIRRTGTAVWGKTAHAFPVILPAE
ncbi:glycosyl transferase family protein [Sphingomonas sp. LY54]|uniref:glycosyl transferase family protein n=1 Tax=Sphingomonas sp. LY54 TaxID=3095343 RepID=UPI002D7693B8|nr:glycosyl transferase family protein [Sphingomonas sp. LY54]WRP27536.1 glycosyl transferase family protein [Sphingomonas sp. LY54]